MPFDGSPKPSVQRTIYALACLNRYHRTEPPASAAYPA